MSLLISGFIGCPMNDNDEPFFCDRSNNGKVLPSVNLVVESPFTDSYDIYSLADPDHNINDYIESIPLEFDQETSVILVKAPYLVYTSEEDRYYYGTVEDTIEGLSSIGPYDNWSLQYNKQPYISSSSDILIKGYHGDNFVSNLSFSLSGNESSPGYYLQNLEITISIPNNITSLCLYFNRVSYSSSYHEVVDVEDIYTPIPYREETKIQNISKTVRTTKSYTTETVTFTATSGYYFKSFSYTIGSGISSIEITSSNLETGTATYKIYLTDIGSSKRFSFSPKALTYRPASEEYEKTITTTYIDGPTISTPTLDITKDALYRYPGFLLSTLTCSGRGDEGDRTMVINAWDDLEETFLSLPNNYQASFSDGTLDDPYLLEALIRYDYVVFYKSYGLTDFASRNSSVNRYYSKSEYKTFVIEKDNSIIVVIIASSISILSITTLMILLLKKKTIQQE